MLPRVVIVGSFMQDLAFFARKFPQPGETVVGEFRSGPGGKGFNQAVAASRAGAPTLFIGAVGRDTFGQSAKKFASAVGLRAQFIEKHKYATGTAGITIDSNGQNQIVVAPGANMALHKQDVPLGALASAHVVVCQGESDYLMVAHVLRHARKAGAVTVLNPAPMRAEFDVAILRHVEVLIPNESEFVTLVRQHSGCASLLRTAAYRELGEFNEATLHALKADALHRLCRCLQVPIVILTLGARGCFVSQPDAHLRMNAHPVEVIDSTGAGDAFVGGFAAGLVKFKKNVVEAAHYANAVAALAVMQPGTAEAMPNPREIARFLRERAHAVR
ncbi:MAG: ribokinase [Opitutae bacterium]|nr:ribokinase [Opitutae bacterium]